MLEIMKRGTRKEDPKEIKELKRKARAGHDIIANKVYYEDEETTEGTLRRRKIKKVNITKMVNETKKLIKTETAVQKTINDLDKAING